VIYCFQTFAFKSNLRRYIKAHDAYDNARTSGGDPFRTYLEVPSVPTVAPSRPLLVDNKVRRCRSIR